MQATLIQLRGHRQKVSQKVGKLGAGLLGRKGGGSTGVGGMREGNGEEMAKARYLHI